MNKRVKILVEVLLYNFGLIYYLIIARGREFLFRTYKFRNFISKIGSKLSTIVGNYFFEYIINSIGSFVIYINVILHNRSLLVRYNLK